MPLSVTLTMSARTALLILSQPIARVKLLLTWHMMHNCSIATACHC